MSNEHAPYTVHWATYKIFIILFHFSCHKFCNIQIQLGNDERVFFYLFLSNEFLCSFRQTEWDPLQVVVVIYNLLQKIQRHYWIYKKTESIRKSTTESIRTATFVTHIMNIANRLHLSNSFSAWLTGFVGWFCFFLTSTISKYLLVKYKFYLWYECVRWLLDDQTNNICSALICFRHTTKRANKSIQNR